MRMTFQIAILSMVGLSIWFANIAMSNGRMMEFGGLLFGGGLFGLAFIGMQLNKPEPKPITFDGYEQERIGFALAASQMLPAYRKDLIRDADIIVKTMEKYNLVLNKPYVREVMDWHLKNTPEYVWDIFGQRAGSRKVYAH